MRQPHVHRQIDDVVDPVRLGDLHRPVGTAIIDDQPFDHVDAGHFARQIAQRLAKRLFLVVAGDLNDQLHRRAL